MNKFRFVFNKHTLLIVLLSLLSSFFSVEYQISIYLDFIFLGIFIALPLTYTLREAFKRRERAIQYLSSFRATLQSSYYYFEISKAGPGTKLEFRNTLTNISARLIEYLSGKTNDAEGVQKAAHAVFVFINANKEDFKNSFSEKILSFQYRINESIDFLLATKRHQTPWGVRATILFGIYCFVIFYPASLLHTTGFDTPFWYVFVMTGFKGFILISLCSVQILLENSFDQKGYDCIRIHDFDFILLNEPGSVEPLLAAKEMAAQSGNETDILPVSVSKKDEV